jgi:flavin reductase (DIM6/NTAB) family NADH-FMN oxidoreductase RutF
VQSVPEPADDSRALRDALGRFATGVTVVTCVAADGSPRGITANSFTSVSLRPPLVLWNIDKNSAFLHAFLGARTFAINILDQDQRSLAERFAQRDADGFAGSGHTLSAHGVPVLDDTLGCLQCRSWRVSECGDHYIIVGEVIEHACRDGDPLLYFGGDYASLKQSQA